MSARTLWASGLLWVLLGSGLARAADLGSSPVVAAPVDRRGEEQTFLTFPEWFLVFSPGEYAQFVRTHNPDDFCFWGHIGQFWKGYAAVIHQTRAHHEPTNWGYHAMIVVIGVSTTVEYAIRSAYETLIGRVTGAIAEGRTQEDEFGAKVAQEYVDFIRERPWYEFDFSSRLRRLWRDTAFFGAHPLRKLERRYALTTEYSVKAVYGKVIEWATHSAYEKPLFTTSVVVDGWPDCAQLPNGITRLSAPADPIRQLALPRYEAFMTPALALAHCGARFEEIAGNRSFILLSAIGPIDVSIPPGTQLMVRQTIITQPGRERVVLIVPLSQLSQTLIAVNADGMKLEHVFDF